MTKARANMNVVWSPFHGRAGSAGNVNPQNGVCSHPYLGRHLPLDPPSKGDTQHFALTVAVAILLAINLCIAATASADPAIVHATVETASVPGDGDAADDPCIWVHPTDPSQSLVIGTDKDGGLMVFDLTGAMLQYFDGVKPNNVDLRYGFPFGGERIDIVVAGDRQHNALAIWKIDPDARRVVPISIGKLKTGLSEVYGSCLYHSAADDTFYAFVNAKDGQVEQWRLHEKDGELAAECLRRFDVDTQTEGCVADDALGRFYIGEEGHGIWRYSADPLADDTRYQVDRPQPEGHFAPDVEGLTLFLRPDGTGYLIASSQGDSTYCIYTREGDNGYLGRFAIGDGAIDGTTETDGIDVTAAPLGDAFPRGMFIAQDDADDVGNQNFKLVPWAAIAAGLRLGED